MVHFCPDKFFLQKVYSFFEKEDVNSGAVVYYFYHWLDGRVMAYHSKGQFKNQARIHKRKGYTYVDGRPVVHVMKLKDKRYLVKYHRFLPPEHTGTRSDIDPLPVAMTGFVTSPCVYAETCLLDETRPVPADCEKEVDRTSLLSEWTRIDPQYTENVSPVPAVISSPHVNPEGWRRRIQKLQKVAPRQFSTPTADAKSVEGRNIRFAVYHKVLVLWEFT